MMFMEEESTTNLPSYDAIFLKFWPILAYAMYAAQNEGLKLGEIVHIYEKFKK